MRLSDIQPDDQNVYVGLLTTEQKDSLIGNLYNEDSYFNPIQDIDENWIISIEEMEYSNDPKFIWVKDLPLILYQPIPDPNPIV